MYETPPSTWCGRHCKCRSLSQETTASWKCRKTPQKPKSTRGTPRNMAPKQLEFRISMSRRRNLHRRERFCKTPAWVHHRKWCLWLRWRPPGTRANILGHTRDTSSILQSSSSSPSSARNMPSEASNVVPIFAPPGLRVSERSTKEETTVSATSDFWRYVISNLCSLYFELLSRSALEL